MSMCEFQINSQNPDIPSLTHVLIHFNKLHLSQRLFNFLWNNFQLWIKQCTVESVLSITVLSDHTCVSGRLSKSRTYFPEITVIFTSIKRSPLPIGRGRPWSETALLYFFFYLCWATYSKNIQIKLGIISQGKLNPCFSPEIKVSSIIEWVFVHYNVNNGRRLFIVSRSQVMGSCRFSFYSFSLRPIFSVKPVLSGRHCSWVIA